MVFIINFWILRILFFMYGGSSSSVEYFYLFFLIDMPELSSNCTNLNNYLKAFKEPSYSTYPSSIAGIISTNSK
jgi:hypothetical protein